MKRFKFLGPFFYIILIWIILFFPFWSKGWLPIPADIITGVYFPWLDYKWGFPAGVPVKNPLLSDIPSLLYPWRSFVIDQLKSFRDTSRNPYYFGGMPLLANFQSAVFSYVNLFFLFLPKALAWSAGVMLSPLLTMIFFYLFLRQKKLGKLPSLLGSLTFGLSGFQIAWLEYNVHGHTVLFFVLILLALDKILSGKKGFWFLLLSLLLAFQIFSGYFPLVIYSAIIFLLYTLFFYVIPEIQNKKFIFSKYFYLFLATFLGVLLSAIQLLPGFELTNLSIRLNDPSVMAASASHLPLSNLLTVLAPDFFGNPATGNYFGKGFYDNFYFFVGTGTLIFAFLALTFFRKDKNVFFWTSCLIFSLIMIFDNPLGHFLEKVFFLSGGVASRALFITDLSLAILSAYGMEKIIKEKVNEKKLFLILGLLFLLLGLAVIISASITNPFYRQVARKNLLLPLACLSASSLLIWGLNRYRKLRFYGISGVLLIVSFQLLYSAKKYLPFSKKEFIFPRTPVIDYLLKEKEKNKEPFRIEIGDVIPQNFLMPYGLEAASGYDALLPKQMGEYISVLKAGKVEEKIARVQFINNWSSPLYPLFNNRFVLAKKTDNLGRYTPLGEIPPVFKTSRFESVFEDKTVVVLKDKLALPRAFYATDYLVSQNDRNFPLLAEKNDFSQSIILVDFPKKNLSDVPLTNKITWLEYEANKIILLTENSGPGFLFLGNNYFPGWLATVDGQPTKIWRANYTFQSVWVDAGRHLVTFEYKPKSFLYGAVISLVALANWLLLFIFCLYKKVWKKLLSKKL
ncbi:MAG: YfhO family protein [Patescibacteria group bacterium]|nr:YfhO family protein [Patescibacteria group bacterium]